jgi:hypothetical protein
MKGNFKKAIAREWLLFLFVFALSPTIVAVYQWMIIPRTSDGFLYENPRIYDVVLLAPGYDTEYRVDARLPKGERNQAILKFDDEHPLKKHKYVLDVVNPKTGKSYEIESRTVLTDADLETIKKDLAPDCTKGDIFDQVACENKKKTIVGGTVPQWDLPDFIPDSPKMGVVQIGQFLDGEYLDDDSRKLLQGIQANGFLTLKKRSLIGYVAAFATSPTWYLYAFIVIYPSFLFVRSIVWSIRKVFAPPPI